MKDTEEERAVKDHAEAQAMKLAADPKIQAWIARLRAVAVDTPKEVWVYVTASSVNVMALDSKGSPFEVYSGLVHEAVVESISPKGTWDGGDW